MKNVFLAAVSISALGIAACKPDKSAEANPAPPGQVQTPAAAANGLPAPAANAALRYVTTPAGNAARYRIREQLVGLDLPNDAIGETKGVTGVVSADSRGKVIPDASKFIIDVSTLTSDKQRRDGFVRGRVLETDQYPTVTFIPTAVRGVTLPLPASGTKTFDMIGNLTVRGNTKPTTWKVSAQFAPDAMTGHATTAFTFTDFGIDQPRVPVVLSVADTIKLELDFSMARDATQK
jgi:polyisoprenoid-binding protein YceI